MITGKKSEAVRFLEKLAGQRLTLGSFLEALRKGEDFSQVDFDKKLRISRAHLCDIEKGRRCVGPARAAKFAKILGYSPERFVKLAIQDELDEDVLNLGRV